MVQAVPAITTGNGVQKGKVWFTLHAFEMNLTGYKVAHVKVPEGI